MKTWQIAAVLTAAAVLALAGAVVRDVLRIDPTSGGYAHPYTEFTGEPIDWSAHRLTEAGFRDDGGWLLNTSLDCTTGQIRGHVGPVTFDYRKLSDRAVAIHKPHVACIEAGFDPEWDYPDHDVAAAPVEGPRG